MDSSFFLTTVAAFVLGTVAAAIGFFTLFRKLIFHQETKDVDSSSSSSPPSSLSPSSVPPSSLSRIWTHHVFPSFRGEDVRRDFLSHIQMEFQRMGITPFIDNEIKRGESIGPELIRAIRGSKIAIILLSRNYASSSWCLDELAEIMKCREELGQTVMAVFYKVDPSEVKKLTGDFGYVFRKTCAGKTKEDIGRWRQALATVATIAGYHSSNWDDEAAMIRKIATDISNKLNNSVLSSDFDGLVGMRAHLEKMEPLLCLDSDEVRMIGIWGPSGIGKTTIARVVYNQLSNSFQLSVFMENINEIYTRPCSDDYIAKLRFQQQLISRITNQKDIEISHLGVAQDRLKDKKVLVVLDGVNHLVQLDAMAKETCWFGPGSRIIITTQDQKLFRAHGINRIYEVGFPATNEALQILCMYAFGQKFPKDGFEELAREITSLAGNLPLGLRVMGSYFRGMSMQEWTNALPKLRTSINTEIESILKFSYDALDDGDKDLFLHIACIFNSERIEKLEENLAKKFLDVRQGLNVLAEKSLISIDERGWMRMHNLLAQLGRDIVRKQSVCEPGQRQFLVDTREICELLTDDAAGSRSVVGIYLLCSSDDKINISERAFEGMSNLQFLRVFGFPNTLDLPGGLDYLSRKLRLLDWHHFPMTCLPSFVKFEFLVDLNMQNSKLEKLWEGIKPLCNLRWMDLSYSRNLKELPDLSTATNLQELDLLDCSSLINIPSSIGNATNLKKLDLSYCSSLINLPSSIGNATNLQELNLSYCSSLINLPSSIGNATNLEKLYLFGCSNLINLPSSIGNATNLQKLYLGGCSSLINLPSSIGNATNLEELDLSNYSIFITFHSFIGKATNLEKLYLFGCSKLINLPSSIGNATNLKKLDLSYCSSLINLPSSIGNATNLQELYLHVCSSLINLPLSIGNVTNLKELDLHNCSSLINLPLSIGNVTNLKELDLRNCSSLINLPSSIGNATNLKKLNLCSCSSLINLPSSIGNATNLQELNLSGCSSLINLPSSIGNATNLKKLDLSYCSSLINLPSSIGNATNLEKLYLFGCSNLINLPSSIGNATNLQKLYLGGCSSLINLPSSIGNATNLQKLYLGGCSSLINLPSSIGNATNLQKLNLSYCSSLVEFPSSIGNATNLEELDLSHCSNLVELPVSIGNLQKLKRLRLQGCSKLEVLPTNINLESFDELDLTNCLMLKSFPEISRNIKVLKLRGTAIEEVPPSIRSWTRLQSLHMSYCDSLGEFPHALDTITELYLSDTKIQEIPPWVKDISRLHILVLKGCRKLVSLPQIPDSLSIIDAEDCESLERLDCSFHNPKRLNFAKCFKLNQETRDLIIQTPISEHAVLPGREVPAYFTHRATAGGSLTIKLNERPLPTSMRFKACILLVEDEACDNKLPLAGCNDLYVTCKRSSHYLYPLLTEHLYIFEVEAEVTSSELLFEFKVYRNDWKIGKCGVVQLLEVPSC